MGVNVGGGIKAPAENNVLQSFSDATAGRSLQLFHAMGTTDSSGEDFILGRDAGNSLPSSVSTSSSKDMDFDITINKATIIAGIASIDVKYGMEGSISTSIDVVFKLIHYDGSTETEVGTVSVQTLTTSSPQTKTTKLQFTVTRKIFKIGDTLRLNVVLTESTSSTGRLYMDPNTAGNELKLWLPIVNIE